MFYRGCVYSPSPPNTTRRKWHQFDGRTLFLCSIFKLIYITKDLQITNPFFCIFFVQISRATCRHSHEIYSTRSSRLITRQMSATVTNPCKLGAISSAKMTLHWWQKLSFGRSDYEWKNKTNVFQMQNLYLVWEFEFQALVWCQIIDSLLTPFGADKAARAIVC